MPLWGVVRITKPPHRPKGARPNWFAEIGRLGGKATGRKGFAAMPPEQVREIRAKALAVRRKRSAKRFQ
jgi:hypothetical protein